MNHRTLTRCLLLLAPTTAVAEPVTLTLEGEVPASAPEVRHFFLPFHVPENIVEIEIDHDDLSEANILDWGLDGPEGFRGWGGGNTEPALVGLDRASRSYLPGPIAPGEWRVVVGKAKLTELPGRYRVEITLRDVPTLAPQPERHPYAPAAALEAGPRWYAGDLHVHSRESGDAQPTLDEVAAFAEARGLDFVMLSDHNTTSQLALYADAQARHPHLLLLPGAEVTTYAGHFNALGATAPVEHRLGLPGTSIEDSAAAVAAQGALVSINHPALELGEACIGCAWRHELAPARIDAVEIGTGDTLKPAGLLNERAVAFWDALWNAGGRPAAVGGSDDHTAGESSGPLASPIGAPTTMVYADELSVDALLAGIRAGRTVVKLHGPEDPMVELTASAAELRATITAGVGFSARWIHEGVPGEAVAVQADPFTLRTAAGPGRWRVEVLDGQRRRTVTSHVVVDAVAAPDAGIAPSDAGAPVDTDRTGPDAAAPLDSSAAAPDTALAPAGDSAAGSGGHPARSKEGAGGCAQTSRAPFPFALLPALALALAAARRRLRPSPGRPYGRQNTSPTPAATRANPSA